MTGISSVPACAVGSVFDSKNPRMDSQRPQEQPASIPVFVVGSLKYLTEGEAIRAAECSAEMGGAPADILVGTCHLDDLQLLRTVTPAEGKTARAARAARLGIETDETTEAVTVVSDLDETETETEATIVEAVPMKASDKPQAWLPPAAHPQATLKPIPHSGLFTLEQWGDALDMCVESVGHMIRRYTIQLQDGLIDAAVWWKTVSNAETRFPVKPTSWRELPSFGIVTISVDAWRPKNARAVPPSLTDGLGMWLSSRYAMLFNASPIARHRGHWACVTTRSGIVVLSGIRLQDRPVDVSTFPPCVQSGLTFHEAEQMAISMNAPRIELSRVPRLWTIGVRMANTIEAEVIDT